MFTEQELHWLRIFLSHGMANIDEIEGYYEEVEEDMPVRLTNDELEYLFKKLN